MVKLICIFVTLLNSVYANNIHFKNKLYIGQSSLKTELSSTDVKPFYIMETRDTKGRFLATKNNESKTRLYNTWNHMRYRVKKDCKHKFTHLYFDKEIDLCDEWQDYFIFKNWALANGYRDNLEIDRKDNSKGYSPNNCRWVTRKVNCNNRDVTTYVMYNGKRESLKLLLANIGKENMYYTIVGRIKRGWCNQKAIDTPIRKGNYFRSLSYAELTDTQKEKCFQMHEKGFCYTEIAKELKSNRKLISKIIKAENSTTNQQGIERKCDKKKCKRKIGNKKNNK